MGGFFIYFSGGISRSFHWSKLGNRRKGGGSIRTLRFMFEPQVENKAGKSALVKASAYEEIQTSVLDTVCLRFLRDNQMEMSESINSLEHNE